MALAMPRMRSALPHMENIGLQTRRTRLDSMTLRNFKGHRSLDLALGRITALIGPTGSGKSTSLQALLVLKSALEEGSVARSGDAYDYGGFRDIVTDGDTTRDIHIGITGQKITSMGGAPDVASSFSYSAEFGSLGRPSKVDAAVEMGGDPAASAPCEMRVDHAYDKGRGSATITGAWMPDGHGKQVDVDGDFAPRIRASLDDHPAAGALASAFTNGEYFRALLAGVCHVPFSRVVTSYALPLKYDADLLSADRAKGASSLLSWLSADPSLQDKVSSLLAEIGLRRIAARNIPVARDEQSTLTVDFVGGRSPSAVVHEGSGSNQLIMLLAVLAGSPKGSVITIEEPEIHLDPETQSRLVGAMVRLSVEEDKQIILTSHSSHILYPLLGYVRKRGCPITSSDVVINYFGTDESGTVAGAERLDLNERGQVGGGLRGFWNANMKALDDLLG